MKKRRDPKRAFGRGLFWGLVWGAALALWYAPKSLSQAFKTRQKAPPPS
jgi:hypothetical protein